MRSFEVSQAVRQFQKSYPWFACELGHMLGRWFGLRCFGHPSLLFSLGDSSP